MQCYKTIPCMNYRPQRYVSTYGEEEDPVRSFFTVEAIIWGVFPTHQIITEAKQCVGLVV